MPVSHSIPFAIGSIITLSTNGVLVAIISVFKIASLIPLLIRWNFPLLEIPRAKDSTWWGRESPGHGIKDMSEPVARVGRNRIIISEPSLIQKILAIAQSDNEVASPLQLEYCSIIDQAEHKIQAALEQWTTSVKKFGRDSVFDGLQRHSNQENHALSELWVCTKMDTWARELVLSILGGTLERKILQEELANSGLRHQASELVGNSILQTLPFLQACVWEALRTCPPLHLLDAQLTVEDELSLWAYRIPTGTGVVLNYNACLNAVCFGPSVHIFQPERWMIDDSEKLVDMRRHVGIVWGKAPSQRLTVDIACMQLRKIVFSILQQP